MDESEDSYGRRNNAGSVEHSGVMKKEMEKNISRERRERSLSLADGWRLCCVGWLHDERLIFLEVEGVKIVYVELEFWIL